MASSASPLGRVQLQGTGDNINTWGEPTLNNALKRLEEMAADVKTITLSGSSTTLSAANYVADEARAAVLVLASGSSLGGTHEIIIPSSKKVYQVFNQTAAIVRILPSGGSACSVPAGEVQIVINKDGTNCVASALAQSATVSTYVIAALTATSTTSNSIGTGTKTFTVDSANKAFVPGMALRAADSAAPGTNYMDGVVTSFSGTTLVISMTSSTGSGTLTAWSIGIASSATNKFQTKLNGTLVGTRTAINIISPNVTAVDDSGNDEVDVTIPTYIHPGHVSGARYSHPNAVTTGTGTAAALRYHAHAFFCGGGVFDRIVAVLSSVGSTTNVGRVGIYRASAGRPDALVIDGGEFSCGSAGTYSIVVSASLVPGPYFLAGAFTFKSEFSNIIDNTDGGGAYLPAGSTNTLLEAAGITADWTPGSLAATFPASSSFEQGTVPFPALYLRKA